MKVLCVGLNPAIDLSVFVQKLDLGRVNRSADSQSNPAGKAVNVAYILSQLGVEVVMSGFLGKDNAKPFIDRFEQMNIDNHCVMVAGQTRQNIKLMEEGRTTDINTTGFVVGEEDKLGLFKKLPKLCQQVDMVVVSGSLPLGFELHDWQKLLQLIKQYNRLVVDTSGEPLKLALTYTPFLIKPNQDELNEALGGCNIHDSRLDGVDHVVLSHGEQGVKWRSDGRLLVAYPPKVNIKSTVGAGDTLLAGMVFGLLKGDDPKRILRRAVAMASYAVSVVGVACADVAQLTKLGDDVSVQEVL